MIDTTVLLSFCYAPCCLHQFDVVGGFVPSPDSFWFVGFWFGGFRFGGFRFGGFQLGGFRFGGFLPDHQLVIVLLCWHRGWFHGFAAAGCV